MPKPGECTPVALHIVGNLDLCVVFFRIRSAKSSHRPPVPPCSVRENVAPEAVLCVRSIKANSILEPSSMISSSVNSPLHVNGLTSRVARLDGARLLHQPSCLRRDSIIVVSGAEVPSKWARHVTRLWWMGLSVSFATPLAFASTLAHKHVPWNWCHQPTMRCNSMHECQEAQSRGTCSNLHL